MDRLIRLLTDFSRLYRVKFIQIDEVIINLNLVKHIRIYDNDIYLCYKKEIITGTKPNNELIESFRITRIQGREGHGMGAVGADLPLNNEDFEKVKDFFLHKTEAYRIC